VWGGGVGGRGVGCKGQRETLSVCMKHQQLPQASLKPHNPKRSPELTMEEHVCLPDTSLFVLPFLQFDKSVAGMPRKFLP
jgi:hypothetical protein